MQNTQENTQEKMSEDYKNSIIEEYDKSASKMQDEYEKAKNEILNQR